MLLSEIILKQDLHLQREHLLRGRPTTHIILNPSPVMCWQLRATAAHTQLPTMPAELSPLLQEYKTRRKWFMWCCATLLCKSAPTSKHIYVSRTTENATTLGKIRLKAFILSSLSFRGGWFMRVCVVYCSLTYCTRELALHHSVNLTCSSQIGRFYIDGWGSKICSNQNKKNTTTQTVHFSRSVSNHSVTVDHLFSILCQCFIFWNQGTPESRYVTIKPAVTFKFPVLVGKWKTLVYPFTVLNVAI